MRYARNPKSARTILAALLHRAHPKNEEVLTRMLAKRYELAQLLGYKSWAQYITEDR